MTFTVVSNQLDLDEHKRHIVNNSRRLFSSLLTVNGLGSESFALLDRSPKAPGFEGWYAGKPGCAADRSGQSIPVLSIWSDPSNDAVNLGVNLSKNWLAIDIDNFPKPAHAVILNVLRRAGIRGISLGRLSKGMPSAVLVKLGQEEATLWNELRHLCPQEMKCFGDGAKVELRHDYTDPSAKKRGQRPRQDYQFLNVSEDGTRHFQQAFIGSVHSNKKNGDRDDPICGWAHKDGAYSVADTVEQLLGGTTPPVVRFKAIVRAINAAFLLAAMEPHYVKGNRHLVTRKYTSFLYKEVMRVQGNPLLDYLPFSTEEDVYYAQETACALFNDDEEFMRKRCVSSTITKLDSNPNARLAGRREMENLLGAPFIDAFLKSIHPHIETGTSGTLLDEYILVRNTKLVVNTKAVTRDAEFMALDAFEQSLTSAPKEPYGKKLVSPFEVWKNSQLRIVVDKSVRSFRYPPKSVVRLDAFKRLVEDKYDSDGNLIPYDGPTETAYNLCGPIPFMPIPPDYAPDPLLLKRCVKRLDIMLGLLTSGNTDQIDFIKKRIASVYQEPETKYATVLVISGGQGVGKTFFIHHFLPALLGDLVNPTAELKSGDHKFTGPQFAGYLIVGVDEVNWIDAAGKNELKLAGRNETIKVEYKGKDITQADSPRLIVLSANMLKNLSDSKPSTDRSLFYILALNHTRKGVTEREFREWAEQSPKRFYASFAQFLERDDVKKCYAWLFGKRIQYTRQEIESQKVSSNRSEALAEANMGVYDQFMLWILERGGFGPEPSPIQGIPPPKAEAFTITSVRPLIDEFNKDRGNERGAFGALRLNLHGLVKYLDNTGWFRKAQGPKGPYFDWVHSLEQTANAFHKLHQVKPNIKAGDKP